MEKLTLRFGQPPKEDGLRVRRETLLAELADVEAQIERAEAEGELSQARKILEGMGAVKKALAGLSGVEVPLEQATAFEASLRDWMAQHTPDTALIERKHALKLLIEQANIDLASSSLPRQKAE